MRAASPRLRWSAWSWWWAAWSSPLARASLVPRLVRPLLVVGEPLPLFGWHYHLARTTVRFSNNPVLHSLFGDSSLIVSYLRLIGYDMRDTTQTGSNFKDDPAASHPLAVPVRAERSSATGSAW
ncbi:MAG: hypothetical protein R2715_04435 [Ilumatobacteraceae bacterium]